MNEIQIAGRDHAGRFCRSCDEEITATDSITVDADAEYEDGCWRDLTKVQHYPVCPPEDLALVTTHEDARRLK